MAEDNQPPQIHVDDDWKAQAQAEKQRLSEQSKQPESEEGESGGAAGRGRMPEASFETLVSTIATQALFAMGAIPDPASGQRVQHLELARHHVDMLGVLEEKTKDNLSEDEANLLAQTVYELRTRYIQLSTAARR